MAVTPDQKPPAKIRDFWPRFKKQSLIFIFVMQMAAAISIGFALIMSGVTTLSTTFWITIGAILVASTGINIILFSVLAQPLKDLTSALSHVSGEPSIETLPNPNISHFEQDSFKPLLQAIYELAASDDKEPTPMSDAPEATKSLVDFSTALNNTQTGFIVLNTKGDITYANKHAPVRTDTDGKPQFDLMQDDDFNLAAWLKECEEKSVHAETTWQHVANKVSGEEGRKVYDIFASYNKGSSAQVVLTLFDQTEGYQPEDEDLDFIAFAAHELRGPITVIRGYLDVLGEEIGEELDESQTELLKRLVVSANRLSSYVNNILNASRYDRRHLKVHLHEDSLAEIYDSISDDMQLRASSQNRLLAVHFPENLPAIAADAASVSEVLSNLIDNAIKYSNEGGAVNVTAAVDGNFVKVAVEDHGIGMPGNVVSNLFHKFYRSHRSRETVAGTGIGLYITKAIVESHGGTVSVRSVEGQGSTFEFSLPIYSTVANKLESDNNSNESLIQKTENGGWIKNHAMYRG